MALKEISIALGIAAGSAGIDGVRYDVETVRYTEVQSKLSRERIRRVRTFADGTVETADIDIRSNAVVEVRTEKRELTPEEQRTIATSPYRKKIFKAR